MRYFLYFILFILGACIVSFLKVLAHDYPQIDVKRRSHCDFCGRILRWFEIIPIIGYFIVHGRCLRCKNQLDFWNPLLEFSGGLLFFLIGHFEDWSYIPLFIMLIILGFSDAFFGYIYPIFYLLSLPTIIQNFHHLHFFIALLTYLILLKFGHHYPLGLGDIDVIAILGLILGLTFILKVTLLACGICLVIFLINKKRSFRFIPYLTIATGIVYLISSFNF